ncbi:MAG: aminotransferase class III-fold pyridoxal phosphate-dependent enzyme [Acidimicrobiia bacterium]|nr:aminotransferase class III-fold pyridoxal phosphate-dependent enzyme [Acidimicrobiia bacterium]
MEGEAAVMGVIGPEAYPDAAAVSAAFAAHVDPGKVDVWALGGLEFVMGEREGATFTDAYDGRRWFNCHCNGGVFNLGHRNPRVIGAVRAAMDHADIGNHHLVSAYRASAAEKLSATTGERLNGVVFSVGGGEAVDLALKVARGHTGRPGIVSVTGAYHGHTGLALAAGDPKDQVLFGHHLPGFTHVAYNDLAAMEAAIGDGTAAVILESIPATAGFPMPEPGYLAAVAELCRQRGALYIADEVQTGLGRTGTVWYVDQEDVAPDLLVTGKGLSGGIYPIAATLMTPEVHRFFGEHPFCHVSTFGGAELGCVAAAEVVDIVTAPGFLERVGEVGERLGEAFADLPFGVRRRGMLSAFVFDDPYGGMSAMKALFDAGVYAFFAGNDPSVLQFKPVLTVTDDEVDEIVRIVRLVLGP